MIEEPLRRRVINLAREGKPPRDICTALEGAIDANNVAAIISQARRVDPSIPRFRAANGASSLEERRTVVFSVEALTRLEPFARARGIHPNELVRRLVNEAVDSKLIDAVLDDGVTS